MRGTRPLTVECGIAFKVACFDTYCSFLIAQEAADQTKYQSVKSEGSLLHTNLEVLQSLCMPHCTVQCQVTLTMWADRLSFELVNCYSQGTLIAAVAW